MQIGGRRQFGAVLLSRQPRRPCLRDAWVAQAERAVSYLESNGMGVVSSVGQSTWELVTSLASIEKLPLRLVLPVLPLRTFSDSVDECLHQFDLSPELVEFVSVPATASRIKSDLLSDRDRFVIELADLLLPVSIRLGGSMERLIQDAAARGKIVHREFQTEYTARRDKLQYAVDVTRLNKHIESLGTSYLFHWTRSTNRHWPGERAIDLYRRILSSDLYRRTAFDTLKHILSEQRLRASTRHMPKGCATVAFSGLEPASVLPLMRWRSRYGEMSFEPYGIGIRREAAPTVGIRPVSYVAVRSSICESPWLCQSIGQKTDWRQEQEFRCLGDLDLRRLSVSDLLVVTLHPHEAQEITRTFGLSAVSFY